MTGCRVVFILLILLSGYAFAGSIQGTCDVRFFGTSTLHDFDGTVRSIPFTAAVSRDAAGNPVVPSVELEFPVADMRTGIETRDGKMREMFQSDRYPVIRAEVKDVEAGRFREAMRNAQGGKVPLDVTVLIRGVQRKVQATAYNWKEKGGRVGFDIEFPLSLKEFELKAPSVIGLIRVGDRVVVKGAFDLAVEESP